MKKRTLILTMLSSVVLMSCNNNVQSNSDIVTDFGDNYKEENSIANKKYLYGMCDIAWSDVSWKNPSIDHKIQAQLLNNLGVKSVRTWLHCNWLMDSPTKYNEKGLKLAREIVEELDKYDFQIIGMNHSNFHASGYQNSSSTVAKPVRDLSEGSYYLQWLEDYKTTWYNLVKAFPEIKYWEIDNEPNNDVFFPKLSGGNFSLQEKANIFTDMLYFASLGIHEANPDANTIMGGLITSNAEQFLQMIYDNIASDDAWSNYPDDYFQIACYHPYMDSFTETKFKRTNDDIYNVIKTNEKKDKKVFLTEFGWSEVNVSLDRINEFIPKAYNVLSQLSYVESAHYFRPFDDLGSSWGSSSEKQFGLFTDPTTHGADNSNEILAAPKITAYTYQQMAQGKGSLTIYSDLLNSID